jgi:hypothetical protein
MDTVKFDAVSRLVGSGMSRRQALRGLVAGAVALGAGGAVHSVEAASPQIGPGRRRKQRKHRKHAQRQDWCGRQGDGCGAFDADTGEYSAPYCCHGYECVYSSNNGSSTWTCQAMP